MFIDLQTRRRVCEDTIARSPAIVKSTPGGNTESTFMPAQLPPLAAAASPGLHRQPVRVVNADSFAAARALLPLLPSTPPAANDATARGQRVAVLNLASDAHVGGGWRFTLGRTQEEALCYSSTLFATLREEWYPWPNLGPGSAAGVYSPGVVVFRDTLDAGLAKLPKAERFVVSVITVAAPRGPALTEDGTGFAKASDLEDLRGKIRLVYRCAAHNGHTSLVLGAMGCGAYACPPGLVAREMRTILEDQEFAGWFENVVFAVYAEGPTGKQNFDVFQAEFAAMNG